MINGKNIDKLAELDKRAKRKRRVGGAGAPELSAAAPDAPVIRIDGGELPRIINEAEAALLGLSGGTSISVAACTYVSQWLKWSRSGACQDRVPCRGVRARSVRILRRGWPGIWARDRRAGRGTARAARARACWGDRPI